MSETGEAKRKRVREHIISIRKQGIKELAEMEEREMLEMKKTLEAHVLDEANWEYCAPRQSFTLKWVNHRTTEEVKFIRLLEDVIFRCLGFKVVDIYVRLVNKNCVCGEEKGIRCCCKKHYVVNLSQYDEYDD